MWELTDLVSPEKAQNLSKRLAYAFGADRGGWNITKCLRVPYTFNHKPEYDLPRIQVSASSAAPIPMPVDVLSVEEQSDGVGTVEIDIGEGEPSKRWRSIYQRYRPELHRRTRFLIESKQVAAFERDRSKCIYEIVADLHRSGASVEEIEAIVWVNPYFISKYGKRLDKLREELGRILPKLGDAK
jgi:hypothetical protein